MPLTFDAVVAEGALRAAWERVADHPDSPGVDGVTIAAFREEVDVHIELLRADLLSESFVPRPLRLVPLPRPDGRSRPIVIACVRDRIVHHAIATTLTPVVEPVLHDDCFAYRPGRSAHAALDRVESRIRAGASWVARCDIADFFDTIDHDILADLLNTVQVDERVVRLIRTILTAPVVDGMQFRARSQGVPQGLACSPVLANLALVTLDAGLKASGFAFVRYADDIAITGSDQTHVHAAIQRVEALLGEQGLTLKSAKTQVGPVAGGFDFLGFRIDHHGRGASLKALNAIRERLEREAATTSPWPEPARLAALASIIRGWQEYYGTIAGIGSTDVLVERALARASGGTDADQAADSTSAKTRTEATSSATDTPSVEEAFAAIPRLRQIVKNEPENASMYRELAERYAAIGQYGLARKAFDQAMALAPDAGDATRERMAQPADRNPDIVLQPAEQSDFLRWFSGRHGTYGRQWVDEKGRRGFSPVPATLDAAALAGHLSGRHTLGIYLTRPGDLVGQMVIDVDVDKAVMVSTRDEQTFQSLERQTQGDATAIAATAVRLGLSALIEDSGYKGRHCWFFFDPPVSAALARQVAQALLDQVGPPPAGLHREVFPAQDKVREGRLGALVKLPLGVHGKSGRRCLFLDVDGRPLADQAAAIRAIVPVAPALVARLAVGRHAAETSTASQQALAPPTGPIASLVRGCEVVARLISKARDTAYLTHAERSVLLYTVGHLGPEGRSFLHAIMSATINYDAHVTEKHIKRLKASPISCARIQEMLQEVTRPLSCVCHFHIPRDGYPSPVLHAYGATRSHHSVRARKDVPAVLQAAVEPRASRAAGCEAPEAKPGREEPAASRPLVELSVAVAPPKPGGDDHVDDLLGLLRARTSLDADIAQRRSELRERLMRAETNTLATACGVVRVDNGGRLVLEL